MAMAMVRDGLPNMLPTMPEAPVLSFGIQNIGDYSYSTKKLSLAFTAATLFYALSGVVMLAGSLIFSKYITQSNVNAAAATALALKPIDLRFGIATSVLVFIAILFAIPGAITNSKKLLKLSSIFNIVSILGTLTLGLSVWFVTLIERAEFFVFWQRQSGQSSAAIQDRFNCCGYFNSTSPNFVVSVACPTASLAVSKQGCFLPFTTFADTLLYVHDRSYFVLSDWD